MESKVVWLGFDSIVDMAEQFEEPHSSFDGMEVLIADYDQGYYEGEAFVLFRRDGKLYEVNGSHCSCFGLEKQWAPEETTVESLKHRLDKGTVFKYNKPLEEAVRNFINEENK